MASLIYIMLILLLSVSTMVNCRFLIYDSDNTKVNIGAQFADVKKTLAEIFSKVNEIDLQTGGTDKVPSPDQKMCPDGWFRFKGSCYYFDSKNLDFQTAEKECDKWGAYIVRLETQEENHFLKAFMANHFKKDTHYWIGMTDIETEGLWKISGTHKIVPFTDWKGTEPQNLGGNEDCAMFSPAYSYGWADVSCSSKFRALCEKKL